MEFFEAAANWAERTSTVVVFERDEFDGWYARIQFRDTNGPYSATVNRIKYNIPGHRRKKTEELLEDFTARVEALLNDACIKAHRARQPKQISQPVQPKKKTKKQELADELAASRKLLASLYPKSMQTA